MLNLHMVICSQEQNELIESAAEMLYGLIHVHYILTSKGLAAMLDKYKNYDFGRCARVYCSGHGNRRRLPPCPPPTASMPTANNRCPASARCQGPCAALLLLV